MISNSGGIWSGRRGGREFN